MLSVDFNSLWSNDYEQIIAVVDEATSNIKDYIIKQRNNENSYDDFKEIRHDICDVCSFWTGKTLVGIAKTKPVENAFQSFFETLMDMLISINNTIENAPNYETLLVNNALYRGKVYRYLGNGVPCDKKIVKPEYNKIFVSWSKEPNNTYFESKLYGTITKISGEIDEPYWGIDLDSIGISRSNEKEVVFPTIEQCITCVEYIARG